jgi:hypothetical protein
MLPCIYIYQFCLVDQATRRSFIFKRKWILKERDATLAIALKRSLVFGGLAAIEQSGWTGAKIQNGNKTS